MDSVQPQANAGELSENELEAVAGGNILEDIDNAIKTAIVTTTVAILDATGVLD
jgi:hypothetical protein